MHMERSKPVSMFVCILAAALLSHNLVVIPVTSASFEEQKNYYPSPDPHTGTPPSGSHGTPPSHGSYGGTPPSHHGTPSHGGGGYHPTPSTPPGGNCGNPPHDPSTPSTPSTPTPSTPSYTPTPSTPSYTPPGGYYNSPPTSGGGSPPSYGGGSPPTTPIIDPGTPSVPTPPFFPAPVPPIGGTCDFWRNHPTLIWGLLGWWGTVGNAFGLTAAMPGGFGSTMSLPQALSNTHTDGLGALYREGTASFLNSMVNNKFPFSTKQVRDHFVAAVGSNKAAAAQARLFKLANEGHIKPRA